MNKDLILESGAKATLKLLVFVSDIGPDFNLKASKVFYGPQIRRFKYTQQCEGAIQVECRTAEVSVPPGIKNGNRKGLPQRATTRDCPYIKFLAKLSACHFHFSLVYTECTDAGENKN